MLMSEAYESIRGEWHEVEGHLARWKFVTNVNKSPGFMAAPVPRSDASANDTDDGMRQPEMFDIMGTHPELQPRPKRVPPFGALG